LFECAPLIAARLLYPELSDAELIVRGLSLLAGCKPPPSPEARHLAGVTKGGQQRGAKGRRKEEDND